MRVSAAVPGGIAAALARRAVVAVLDGERAGPATVSVTFLSPARMRALNRRVLGHDRATDVIAWSLPHASRVVGDIYVCPAVGRRSATEHGVPAREEIVRLVIHGTLHVLGHDHPAGPGRERAPMWRRQERYLARVLGRS